MNAKQIQQELDELSVAERMRLLICYGHQLTIVCRIAYEFQAPGVTDPQLLRDANEIHHRLYQAIRELERGEDSGYSVSGISNWISEPERRDEIQNASTQAIRWALEHYTLGAR